jgi:hypothetical protein
MATFKSTLVQLQEAAALRASDGLRDGDDAFGIVALATATVTLTGATAADDILEIVPAAQVPVGAVVVPQLCSVQCSADPGTTLTLDVGDAGNTDRYADGIVLSAGGQVGFCSTGVPAAAVTPYRITEQGKIYATVASANTITNGTTLTFIIAYRAKA